MRTLLAWLMLHAARLKIRVYTASHWKRTAIAFAAGALSVLAMAPFFFSPILLVTLPVLVWLIDSAYAGRHLSATREPRSPTKAENHADAVEQSASLSTDRAALLRAAASGWFFGFGYFLFGMFWIGEAFLVEAEKFAWLLPVAVLLLPAGLAAFFAIAAVIAKIVWRPGFSRVLILATAIGITEGLRGFIFTGLPWNTLGYALTFPLVLMQSSGLVGIYGLTVLTVIVFACSLVCLAGWQAGQSAQDQTPSQSWRAVTGIAVSFTILVALVGYGSARLIADNGAVVSGVKLRIVQPSVPQRDKWQPEKQREIFDLHVDLTGRGPDGTRDNLAGITHVIWPEAAMPFLPLESPQALKEIGDLLPPDVYLISGALRVEEPQIQTSGADTTAPATAPGTNVSASRLRKETTRAASRRRAYNSLMAFGPNGELIAVYDKIHLVPFGEYLPFQSFLESIGLEQLTRVRGGFESGRSPRPIIDVPGLPPFVALVCYEAIFPAAVVQGKERPKLIINVTNDGWFGDTTGPRQHLHMARVRAVEEGLSIIRAANNGISAVIDPYGRLRSQLNLNQRGVVDSVIPVPAPPTIYALSGNLLYMIYIIASASLLVGLRLFRI